MSAPSAFEVVDLETRDIVHRLEIGSNDPDRVLAGLLSRIDVARFYVREVSA